MMNTHVTTPMQTLSFLAHFRHRGTPYTRSLARVGGWAFGVVGSIHKVNIRCRLFSSRQRYHSRPTKGKRDRTGFCSLFPCFLLRRSFPYSMNVCFCCASPYHYPCGVAFIPCHRRPSAACGAGPPYPNSCKGKYTQLQRHWHLRKKRDRAGFFAHNSQ